MTQKEELKNAELRNTPEYIAELEGIIHLDRQMKGIVGHEIRNRLHLLTGFPKMLINSLKDLREDCTITPEQKFKLIDYSEIILRNVKQLESIATLLSLGSISHRELKKSSEQINLEEAVRNNILSLERELEKNNLGIFYQYDRLNGEPICIHANKGFIDAIMNTILFNLIKHAPQYSLSRQGIRIKDSNLELITENLVGKSREEYGSRTGVGIYLLELASHQLKGKLELYLTPSNGKYQFQEIIGYKDAQELKEHDTFGIKLSIPMTELTFHPPKK